MRCDVIVPTHNQSHWLVLCLEELYRCTPAECLGEVFLIDDASDGRTAEIIASCQAKYPSLTVITHGDNLGYARSVNDGIKRSSADYVLLLNTDCLLTPNAIPKLMAHCERNPQIGMISPFSNNSSPLTFEMFHGYSYRRMNDLFTRTFSGLSMEACTIVGNALMITSRCLAETGAFDVSYGRGYGEETDYQFRAMAVGFKCMAALDTYVYHRGRETFGDDLPAKALRAHNYDRFMQRWGPAFEAFRRRVPPDGPRERIAAVLERVDLSPCGAAAMFVMASLGQTTGGCHAVVDICNMAARLGVDIQLSICNGESAITLQEPLFFRPICFGSEQEFIDQSHFAPDGLIATLWTTVFPCRAFARKHGIPLIYFVQGYEFYFDNGVNYRGVEESFRDIDHILTSSKFLKDMLAHHTSAAITVLPLGYDERCFHEIGRTTTEKARICVSLRGSLDKGQPFLMDFLHRLSVLGRRVEVNVITKDPIYLPSRIQAVCKVHSLPLRRTELADIFRNSDIFVDASLHEGWALSPLEALACGCTIVVSDSGGVTDYAVDGENAKILPEVNKPGRYFEEVARLIEYPAILRSLCEQAPDSVRQFAGDPANREYCRTIMQLIGQLAAQKKAVAVAEMARIPSAGVPANGPYDVSQWVSIGQPDAGKRGTPEEVRTLPFVQTDHVSRRPAAVAVAIAGANGMAGVQGNQVEERLMRIEASVSDIYNSRVWRALCSAGKVVLFFSRRGRYSTGGKVTG